MTRKKPAASDRSVNQDDKKPVRGWHKRASFMQWLVATFSIGIFALSLLSSYTLSRLSYQIVRSKLLEQGLQATGTFAEQSALALLYASKENAEKPAQTIMAFPDVSGVAIYTRDYSVLFSAGEPVAVKSDTSSWPDEAMLQQETDAAWYFVAPVVASNGAQYDTESSPFEINQPKSELLGFVRLAMSKHSLKAMERNILQTSLLVSGLFALIFLLFLAIATQRLTGPLRQLALSMGLASSGQKNVRAHLVGPRDIVEMEAAFNTMMQVLETREQQLERARDAALDSARLKGEFAANVSHELRTPLNAVLGMLELLQDMGLSSKQADYVAIARNAGATLLQLIEDILDFSRIEAGMMKLQPVDFVLYEILDEIVDLLSGQAQRKQLELRYTIANEVPMVLHGEASRLRQVLVNLLGNALKFTEEGSITIKVEPEPFQNGCIMLRFSVTDTGPGIAPAAQASIFDPFMQGDSSRTRHYDGAGLGLAICRQLTQLMGGAIGVDSELGRGSSFWFKVPFAPAQNNLPLSDAKRAYFSHLRILIVTDSDKMRQFLSQNLEGWKISYRSVGYGIKALDMLRTAAQQGEAYQFAIIDLLPASSVEQDWLTWLLQDPMLMTVRLILLTNPGQPVVPEHLQIAARLSKPIQISMLFDCLVSLEKGYQQPDEPRSSAQQATRMFSGQRILIVEDNRASQQVAIGMLERLGCHFDTADTGLDALQKLACYEYDLVLMDCHMPKMDGYEATRRIRALPGETARVPIIAMTANAQQGDSDLCLAAGMDDYLTKPLRLNDLKQKLQSWLKQDVLANCGATSIGEHVEIEGNVLDVQVLKQLHDEIGHSFVKMLKAYLEDVPMQLQSIREALNSADSRQLRELAHSLKGASRNLGAERLAATAKKLEEQAHHGVVPDVDATMQHLLRSYEPVRLALERELMLISQSWPTEHMELRILIVDDDRALRFALHDVLDKDNYTIEQANNGMQAVVMCTRQMPDLILMDAIMPEMDGFDACQKIRTCPGGAQVPILMITALDDEQSVERAFAVGANDYIPKPIHFAVLRQRVARLLEAGRVQRNLNRLAYQDSLTHLANRTQFMEQLTQVVHGSQQGKQHAILFLDLDRFKLANDTLGHDVGDLLLKAAAERIQHCVRNGDLVSRFGGDEFTLLLENISSANIAVTVAEKICRAIAQPFTLMEREFYLSASIGITFYPKDSEDPGQLIKQADTAMYRAKEHGNTYRFYESSMEQILSSKLRLENDLRRALQGNDLFLLYQPQVNLTSGRVIGTEALIRWQHPELGLISPDVFIPIAEEAGLIDSIGEWVLREACRQAKIWQQQCLGILKMAVNVSARQFEQPDFVDKVSAILDESGLSADSLELELTESTVIKDPEKSIMILNQLKGLGIEISIDDFGTGYSSLSQLKHFAFDKLKIDKSFVAHIMENSDDAAIVLTIISIAKILKFKVIAEGVETHEQARHLFLNGCDEVQGYYFGCPMTGERIEALVRGSTLAPSLAKFT